MSELPPTIEDLSNPYVLQLIEALSMQQDQIEHLTTDNKWAGEQLIKSGIEIERLTAELKGAWHDHGVMVKQYEYRLSEAQHLQARVDVLEGALNGLECESEWCGKSPHGTPGKRGYDDGKCQICKALAATEQGEVDRWRDNGAFLDKPDPAEQDRLKVCDRSHKKLSNVYKELAGGDNED